MTALETFVMDADAPEALPGKRCYSIEDIMAILEISRPTAYNLLAKKLFRSVKVGGKYRISKVSFNQWLDQQM